MILLVGIWRASKFCINHFLGFRGNELTRISRARMAVNQVCNEPALVILKGSLVRRWGKPGVIIRAHSFPRQILLNSAAPFAKFRGSPRQILGNPRLTTAAHFRVHCADFGPVIYT